jgi:hypothetical protein
MTIPEVPKHLKRCFAVIHVTDRRSAIENCECAREAGMSGVFLISHGHVSWRDLSALARPCLSIIPYVGVNYLDLLPEHAIPEASKAGFKGVWEDSAITRALPHSIEVFGGFAFKHQPQPDDLPSAASEAAKHVDVVTTSGPHTGAPPTISKVATIRAALGPNVRLAIASGMTPENVNYFTPYVDDFLVATGINNMKDYIDIVKATEFADVVRRASFPR